MLLQGISTKAEEIDFLRKIMVAVLQSTMSLGSLVIPPEHTYVMVASDIKHGQTGEELPKMTLGSDCLSQMANNCFPARVLPRGWWWQQVPEAHCRH